MDRKTFIDYAAIAFAASAKAGTPWEECFVQAEELADARDARGTPPPDRSRKTPEERAAGIEAAKAAVLVALRGLPGHTFRGGTEAFCARLRHPRMWARVALTLLRGEGVIDVVTNGRRCVRLARDVQGAPGPGAIARYAKDSQ